MSIDVAPAWLGPHVMTSDVPEGGMSPSSAGASIAMAPASRGPHVMFRDVCEDDLTPGNNVSDESAG